MSLVEESPRLPCTAYVLAAGRSLRFGSNKAFAHWQGVPFLTYQLQLLRACFVRVKVIAPAKDTYQTLGIDNALVDRFPYQGPLAGLDTALQDLQQERPFVSEQTQKKWLFLASCDTFGICPEDILKLGEALRHTTPADQAVLWRNDQRIEPLWGFYSSTLSANVYQRLCEDRLAMHSLLKAIQVKTYDGENLNWIQVNSLTDFKH